MISKTELERRRKISEKLKGRKGCGYIITLEIRKKISESVSKRLKEDYKNGRRKTNKGKHVDDGQVVIGGDYNDYP